MERKIYAIVMAAGRGSRFGARLPKQYVDLDGVPVLVHAVRRFQAWRPDIAITVVINPADEEIWSRIAQRFALDHVTIAYGGDTRWESVRNALQTITPGSSDIVMVHDGARPIITSSLLDNILAGVVDAGAAVPAIPLTDSIRRLTPQGSAAVDRTLFRAVQTPQAFCAELLKRAYQLPYSENFTDDASVWEAAGHASPLLVDGDIRNIKITHPRDIDIAHIYLAHIDS